MTPLFPFYRPARLRGDIPKHAVDAFDFRRYAGDDLLHKREIDLGDLGGDGVDCVDGADDDWPVVRAQTVGDAGRFEVGNDGEVLPYLALKTRGGELLAEDRVALADRFEPVARDRADAADSEAGSRERLTFPTTRTSSL